MRIEPRDPSSARCAMGSNGVIHMGLLNIIWRMALREKLSIGEIVFSLTRRDGYVACEAMRRHIANTAACADICLDEVSITAG